MTGYTKIVQYGNIIETYEYEKKIHRKPPSAKKAWELAVGRGDNSKLAKLPTNLKARRQHSLRQEAKRKSIYARSEASAKRTRTNFFRLCHHNNCLADSIHFLTLTFVYDVTYTQASRHVKRFMEKLRKYNGEVPVNYISVPELTEKGRFHFHLLVYNLSPRLAGEPIKTKSSGSAKITTERKTRNLQVLFERGYVDIVPATYTSRGIAGYMAKYMAKSLADTRYETTRGYNCSRGIKKIYSAGSNSLDKYYTDIIPEEVVSVEEKCYDVPYLGNCRLTKIITKTCL